MLINQGQKAKLQQLQLQMLKQQMLNPAGYMGAAMVPVLPQGLEMVPEIRTPGQQKIIQKIRESAKSQKRQYITIKVENTTPEVQNVVLFDALGTYQYQNNIVINPGVLISGPKKNYQVLQTRFLGGNTLYFDQINLYSSDQSQFDNPVNIYQDNISTNNSMLIQTIDMSEGLNSMQQQENRVEVYNEFAIKPDTAWQYEQQPESLVIWRLFISEQVSFD